MATKDDYEKALAESERLVAMLTQELESCTVYLAQSADKILKLQSQIDVYDKLLRKTRNALAAGRADIAAFVLNEALGLNS